MRPCMNSSADSWSSRSESRAGTWSSGTSTTFPGHPAERSTTRVWRRSWTPTEAWLMELTNWRQLSDRGPDLVPCLDFPGARAAAGFAELAAGVPVDACFLHFRQTGAGPLAACVGRWGDELLATGRPVRAVLGYCAGTALATRLADAIAVAGGLGQSNTVAGGLGQSNTVAGGLGQSNTVAGGLGQSNTVAGGVGQSNTATGPPPTVVL